MKKLRLLAFAFLLAGAANAQYFQHVYGAQSVDVLESGVNAFMTNPGGHIMAGYTDATGFNSAVMITGTDLNGNIVSYNNFYQLSDATGALSTKGRRVVEVDPNTIGVWGDYINNTATPARHFFYMTVDANGNPTGLAISFTFPFFVADAEATSMCYSPSTGNVYMCGYIRHVAGGPRSPIVFSVNGVTGAFNWGREYQLTAFPSSDWTAMDVVESPFPDPNTGNTDIALCGHLTVPGLTEDGCFFQIDEPSSNITTPGGVIAYGTQNTNEGLNAIDVAINSYGGDKGFIMAGDGFNPASGNEDCWALKTDRVGTTVHFSSFHDYSLGGRNEFGNDIIERLNTLGDYEYYLGGFVDNGVFARNDALVYKLDFKGNAVGAGQFTYGGRGHDQCQQLDQDVDGLSVYGNTNGSFPLIGQNDFYFVKSYFNGITSCNFDIQTISSTQGPGLYRGYRAFIPNKVGLGNMQVFNYGHMSDFEICFDQSIPAGDNSRVAATAQNSIAEPGYFPNPVSHSNAVVTVNFGKAAIEGEAEIELWNALGQLCWSKKASVADGQTQMDVQLGNELSGGMYHLIVKQNGVINNYRIVVQ